MKNGWEAGKHRHGFIWAGLWVEDLGASTSFYKDVIGLRLLNQGDDRAHFYDPEGNWLEIKEISSSVKPG